MSDEIIEFKNKDLSNMQIRADFDYVATCVKKE